MRSIPYILIALLASAAGHYTVLAGESGTSRKPFQPARPGYTYLFPRDHGSHERFRTEWWYYTGHLTTEDGHRFGYQLTFFRRGVDHEDSRMNPSRWAIRNLYLAHAALSDVDEGRFHFAEKVSRAGIGKAGAEADRLHVWIDRWTLQAVSPDHGEHRLQAATDEFGLDLTVKPEKPPVVHGREGVSRKGGLGDQASHYYSLTRLATAGTVSIGGKSYRVTGTSWMDHEFGSADLGEEVIGWDWFSAQLDDRGELMLYQLRQPDGRADPASSGTWISPDGRAEHLASSDFRIEVLDHWTSPTSGARYPSRWRITVPAHGLVLDAIPLLADQELRTDRSTLVAYWEGAVSLRGRKQDAPLVGRGYVELTGYAEPFKHKL